MKWLSSFSTGKKYINTLFDTKLNNPNVIQTFYKNYT